MPSASPQPLATTLADAPRRWFLGTETWVRVGTQESGGSLAIIEHLIPPGSESPWHVHHAQDEVLYVIEGQLTVLIGEDRWTLGPAGCTFGPRSVPHGFRVGGDGARVLLICTPGDGFDRFIEEASEPATAPGLPAPRPPDVARISRLAAEHGMTVLGRLPA